MSGPFLSIRSLERRLATGNVEPLTFEPGVNVFVGRPNTGKTKWLQTLDFLLGDTGANRSIDFNAAAQKLEDGMNAYLAALNLQRPDTWKHNVVEVDISKSSTSFRIGRKRWQGALGGTDSLYFLMAYHYGLMSLSPVAGMHYPGLSIIDVPGEFSGEEVKDSENFIVQPFIDLLGQKAFEGAQLIITGASFAGLQGVHVQKQTHVHVA